MRVPEDFWAMVKKNDAPEACWLWQGGKAGAVNWCGNILPLRRVAWMIQKGEIQDPCRITTTCENRLCVRDAHLIRKEWKYKRTRKPIDPPKAKRVPKPAKEPLVVVDNPRLAALLQEVVGEADRVEKKCDAALLLCHQAFTMADEILIKLSESKDRIDTIAGRAIQLFSDPMFRSFAEEGRMIHERRKK